MENGLLLVLGILLLVLTSCAAPVEDAQPKVSESSSQTEKQTNLEQLVKAIQSEIPALEQQFHTQYSKITITAEAHNTVVYTYTYTEAAAPEVPISDSDKVLVQQKLNTGMKTTMDQLKKVTPDAQIKCVYLNPDKTEVAHFVITQADVAQNN